MRSAALTLFVGLGLCICCETPVNSKQSTTPPLAPGVVAPGKERVGGVNDAVSKRVGIVERPILAPESKGADPVSSERTGAPQPASEKNSPVVPVTAPNAASMQGVIAPQAAVGNANQQKALTVPELFAWIQQNDRALALLEPIKAQDWTAEPTKVFLNSSTGYVTADGANASLPFAQPPSLLQEYKCTHILIKRFVRPQRTDTVYIYSFREPAHAFGAYSAMRMGSSNVVVRGDASSEDDKTISFWQGRRFVVLTTSAEDDEVSKNLISKLADDLSKVVSDHAYKPDLINALPVLDRVVGTERLVFGVEAARRYTNPPLLRSLLIEESQGAAIAEYTFTAPMSERLKVTIIEYGDPTMSRRIFDQYTGSLSASHKTQPLQANMQLCKLNDTYMLTSISGSRIALITGARKKVAPVVLARQFAY